MIAADLLVRLDALPGLDPHGLFLTAGKGRGPGWCTTWASGTNRVWLAGAVEDWPADDTFLDLADASTRDRVARWVAERVGIPAGCTAPTWEADEDGWSTWSGSDLETCGMACWDREGRGAGAASGTVPGFTGLDPSDATLLADGSRRVDAIALGRVAVHLGSRS